MNGRHTSDLLNFQKVETILTRGGSLYSLSRSIALHAVLSNHKQSEQRKYPRFQPDIKMYVLHSTLGMVNNISINGMSYTYYQLPDALAKPLPTTGTIFSAEGGIIKDIPFTVLADTVKMESPPCFPELKQRRITFDGLTESQCDMLEEFILNHVMVPKSEFNDQHDWSIRPKLAHVRQEAPYFSSGIER
jgi:hypothetical protein